MGSCLSVPKSTGPYSDAEKDLYMNRPRQNKGPPDQWGNATPAYYYGGVGYAGDSGGGYSGGDGGGGGGGC
jgi:hypothetical protein